MPKQPAKSVSLDFVEQLFNKYQLEFTPKFAEILASKVKIILLELGLSEDDQSKIGQIIDQTSKESAREVLSEVPKIQDLSQLEQVVIDSLEESLLAQPHLSKFTQDEGKIFKTVAKEASDISTQHQKDLETVATLGQIVQLNKLKKPSVTVQSLINSQLENIVEKHAPLAKPEVYLTVKNAYVGFLREYLANLQKELAPRLAQDKIPSFEELQKAKEKAYNNALGLLDRTLSKAKSGLSAGDLTPVAYLLGLVAIPPQLEGTLGFDFKGEKMFPRGLVGFFLRILLAAEKNQLQTYYSLLAYDQDELEHQLKEINSQLERSQAQKSLTLRDFKVYQKLKKRQRILKNARDFALSKPENTKAYQTMFQGFSGITALKSASHFAWFATEGAFGKLPGIYVPKDHLSQDYYLAQKIVGSLTYGFSN